MRHLVFAFTYITIMLVGPHTAMAAAGACYNIGDADARTYCLALERREPGQCYSIQSSDLRARCLAEVRR